MVIDMTRQIFLDTLRRMLSAELTPTDVADYVNYYQNYIDEQIMRGEEESVVLNNLGSPRLIAKNILSVHASGGSREHIGAKQDTFDEYDSGYEEENDRSKAKMFSFGTTGMGLKGWLILLIFVMVIGTFFSMAFSIIFRLIPFLLPVLFIWWVIKYIRRS